MLGIITLLWVSEALGDFKCVQGCTVMIVSMNKKRE